MKLRNLTLITGLLASFIFTHTAFALGIGELKLNSALNEPLDAEVELLNTGDLTELEMLIGLASNKDFEAAGVDRLFMLTDLSFAVDMSAPGKPLLRITSRKPIREPYLNFLLEVEWPSGRLLREYTLLLDLPVYATEKTTAKKVKAASTSPQPPQQTTTSETNKSASHVAASNNKTSLSSRSEYRVIAGDTAWGIAQEIKPDNVSVMQSLAALKQSNPNAFINDNVNLLKSGAVLRIPSSTEISQISYQAASAVVDLDTSVAIADKAAKKQLDATTITSQVSNNTTSTDVVGRLKLATPNDHATVGGRASGTATSGGGSSTSITNNLENEFAIFQEELDKTHRENEELKIRLSNMEEQIATMSRLVEINDDSLRAAQLGTQQNLDELLEDTEALLSGGMESTLIEDDLNAEETTDVEVLASTSLESDSIDDSNLNQASLATASSVEVTNEEGGFNLSKWIDLLLYPLIGFVVLLLAIILFFKNRKQEDDVSDELSLRTLVEPNDKDEEEGNLFLNQDDQQFIDEDVTELDEQELKELAGLDLVDGEGVDPEGEADIYLSLGNFDQAEEVLIKAIDSSPGDSGLRLKLLSIYVDTKNLDKFDAQYEQLLTLGDTKAQSKAGLLRLELSPQDAELSLEDSELESHYATDNLLSAGETELDLDSLDLELDGLAAKAVEAVDNQDLDSSEFNLDLDLENIDLSNIDLENIDLGDFDVEKIDIDLLASDIDAEMESFDAAVGAEAEITDNISDSTATVGAIALDDFDSFNEDTDLLEGDDECSTKLELAQAYLDMGDPDSARDILDEVVSEGDTAQQQQALKLIEDIT